MAVELTAKSGLKVITNGNIWKKKQYDAVMESEIFGVRFSSKGQVENTFSKIGV